LGLGARLWRLLTAQRTGILCALVSAALLGFGSLLMDARPEQYSGLSLDDLRFFFAPWRLAHLWFYILCLTLGLWGTSAALCTWDTVTRLLRNRVRLGPAWGPPLLHVAFVLALGAHLWGGLAATSSMQTLTLGQSVRLGDARLRLLRVLEESSPSGMPRRLQATFARLGAPDSERRVLGYNEPLLAAAGAESLLLMRHEFVPTGQLDPQTGLPDAQPLLLLHHRYNPSVPLVIAASVLVALGVFLVLWGRLQRPSRNLP